MALNERQRLFAGFYVELGNATEAAKKAGYSEKTAYSIGQRLLKKVEVQNLIREIMAQKDAALIASQDEVLKYLTAVLRGEIEEDCVVVEGCGDGCSEARNVRKQVSPKDRNKAAELLAKRYGMLTENFNLSGTVAVQIVDDVDDE